MQVICKGVESMKKLFVSLALVGALVLTSQNATLAAWEGMQTLNPLNYVSYLNPLPYIGIGQNRTSFSLNPFTGFKNCNPCRIQRTACNECTRVKVCPNCQRAFNMPKCNSCDKIYIHQPRCTSCERY